MTSEQGETQDVYANPDGTFTAELRAVPVRVRRDSGWVPVDPTLRKRADGGVEPVATTVPVVFSGGGDQPLVRLARGSSQVELRWPEALPEPVLDGASATYPEVLPGVDLRMTASAQGFTQTLVVKDRAAAEHPKLAELALDVDAKGARARRDEDDVAGFYDEKGTLVLGTGAAVTRDAAPAEAPKAVDRFALDEDRLVLRPDRKALTDSATTFPVEIMAGFPATRTGFAMVLSGHPGDPYWGGDGDNVAKVGYCGWSYCNGIGVARSYFQFDAAALAGKHILGAEFNAFETYAPSCVYPRDVVAYGTSPVNSGTTWSNQPYPNAVYLYTHTVAYGYSSACPGKSLGFPAAAAVTNGLTRYGGTVAIMLKAGNEGDAYAWKKFATTPTLEVTYNSYPGVPTAQTVEGVQCAVEPNEPRVNPHIDNDPNLGLRGPQMAAKISDPDGGLVSANFEWYTRFGPLLGTVTTGGKQSGATFTADVPAANAPDGARLAYRVRGTDGVDFGPWGPWCDVTIDRTGPDRTPKVSSSTYPECPPPDYDPCPRGGAVGFTGGFALNADGVTDVAAFEYYLYGHPDTFKRVAASSSGTANVLVTPPEDGPMDLYVRSVDRAGNAGPEYRYHFWVGRGTPPKGHWKLEGYDETAVVDDSPNGHDGTVALGTAARWRIGRHGDALWLDGAAGHVNTAGGPTVETDKSFTVAAWVKLDRLDAVSRVAVSQDGSQVSGFALGYDAAGKKWTFRMRASDAGSAASRTAESATPAVAGRWTHLVGVYDAATQQVKIYVDGVAGASAGHTTPWKATGSVQLGRARSAGGPADYWPGALDEVRIYSRVLSAEEIHDLAGTPAAEELFLPLDEGTGATAQDVSGNYRLGTLGSAGSWTAGRVGTGAVLFDGTAATLSTSGPAVRTDASFTVTARVRLDAADAQWRTVLSQDGSQGSGFQLRYRGDTRKWSFALPASETDSQLTISVDSTTTAQEGEWTHLAGVYDAADQKIRLYVDGAFVGEKTATAKVNATGVFQIGRGKASGAPATPFAGAIDDVHAWTGVRTADQIRDEYGAEPVTRNTNHYGGQLGRFYNLVGRHIVTTGQVPPGSHFEFSLGLPAPADAPNTVPVYSCRNGATDYFLSFDCQAEGPYANLGSIGKLYSTPPEGVPTLRIYRCVIPNGGGHFASTDPGCEGMKTEGPLGHTRAYRHLVRHVTTGHPHDHATSGSRVEAHYRPEGNIGTVPMVQLPGTTALLMCRNGVDIFTSTDPGCEGQTTVKTIGYIWTAPPQDVPGMPGTTGAELFRCRTPSGDLFDTRDRHCEGQTLDRSLGFVAIRL
ncbi:LamG-like jellyroll fold domain-containing protein [Thermoactinospora rubra]|uniref:LamG-like jellyroll fold domain-containing protein n=1 Tax=Thermoactinospora rubra TaxID=1088767 RepID=UPI00117E364A|nr:LamG-like jellyroll fold domain-containing protein [Thermoactinospora rubra]